MEEGRSPAYSTTSHFFFFEQIFFTVVLIVFILSNENNNREFAFIEFLFIKQIYFRATKRSRTFKFLSNSDFILFKMQKKNGAEQKQRTSQQAKKKKNVKKN